MGFFCCNVDVTEILKGYITIIHKSNKGDVDCYNNVTEFEENMQGALMFEKYKGTPISISGLEYIRKMN